MTRTPWLLTVLPCVLSVAIGVVVSGALHVARRDWAFPVPAYVEAMMVVAFALPLLAAVPAWPLRWRLLLLVPVLYLAVYGGWALAALAVDAWGPQFWPSTGPGFDGL